MVVQFCDQDEQVSISDLVQFLSRSFRKNGFTSDLKKGSLNFSEAAIAVDVDP